jgi:hypothetical protein
MLGIASLTPTYITNEEQKMTIHKLKLVAPNSLPIVGMRFENGTFSEFEYTYDDQTLSRLYVLPDDSSPRRGKSMLIDSGGNEWNAADVEFHSLMKNK